MPRFRKRPIVVEAEQWFPGKAVEGVIEIAGVYGVIQTLEGYRIVKSGDWIITGSAGEKYPCAPAIFDETYEPVQEDQAPRVTCPDCGAEIPADGVCWYCETMPEPLKKDHEKAA